MLEHRGPVNFRWGGVVEWTIEEMSEPVPRPHGLCWRCLLGPGQVEEQYSGVPARMKSEIWGRRMTPAQARSLGGIVFPEVAFCQWCCLQPRLSWTGMHEWETLKRNQPSLRALPTVCHTKPHRAAAPSAHLPPPQIKQTTIPLACLGSVQGSLSSWVCLKPIQSLPCKLSPFQTSL